MRQRKKSVCRFYDGKNGGPNTHFYSSDDNECVALKSVPQLSYEGQTFAVNMPMGRSLARLTVNRSIGCTTTPPHLAKTMCPITATSPSAPMLLRRSRRAGWMRDR